MAEEIEIRGGNEELGVHHIANVDRYGNIYVNMPQIPGIAGYIVPVVELGPSNNGQDANITRFPMASEQNKFKTGADKILLWEVFNGIIVNQAIFNQTVSTMTIAQASNFLVLNDNSSFGAGNYAILQTYRRFPLYGVYPIRVDFRAKVLYPGEANKTIEIGLASVSGTTAAADGCFFRWKSDGTFEGVVNNNSVEVNTGSIGLQPDSIVDHYTIIINNNTVEFWINNVLSGVVQDAATFDLLNRSGSLPFVARIYCNSAITNETKVYLSQVVVSLCDADWNKNWYAVASAMGKGSYQEQSGVASGLTANWANTAAPSSATLSNTAAGYTTLGGQFQWAAVAGAETDYALFAYQVPAGTTTLIGKTLHVTGITIDTYNTGAANSANATVMQWGIGVGSTAVSLATVDAAATKAPRRIPVGVQNITNAAAIGFLCTRLSTNFDVPLTVDAGHYFHVIVKIPLGDATGSQIIRGVVMINGYFE